MVDDPWASDEPMIEPADYMPVVSNTKETVTVTTNEDTFTITLKQSGGYEAPWVVIRSGSAEEAKSRLNEAVTSGLFDAVNQAVSLFAGQTLAATKPAFQPASAQQNFPSPAAPAAAPSGDAKTCVHGVMNFKSGVNQTSGKPWKGHFCPTPKGTPDQCRPVFF